MKLHRWVVPCILVAASAGCGHSAPSPLLGTLEWDRVSLPAEASEAVLTLPVAEGAHVKAGDVLVTLDGRRMGARITQAEADPKLQQDLLAERLNGPRIEENDAAKEALKFTNSPRIATSWSLRSAAADSSACADWNRRTDSIWASFSAGEARRSSMLGGSQFGPAVVGSTKVLMPTMGSEPSCFFCSYQSDSSWIFIRWYWSSIAPSTPPRSSMRSNSWSTASSTRSVR